MRSIIKISTLVNLVIMFGGLLLYGCDVAEKLTHDVVQSEENNHFDNIISSSRTSNSEGAAHNASKQVSNNPSSKEIVLQIKPNTDVDKLLERLGVKLLDELKIGDAHFIKISNSAINLDSIKAYSEIISAEYDVSREYYSIPNDAYYSSQYSPQITGLEDVWEKYTGKGVYAAVIDTGVNTQHEDFGGPSAFKAGYDFATDQVYATNANHDEEGHGTHVAGIIGARRNNNKGIVGVAPDVTLIPIRAKDPNASFVNFGFLLAKAIMKAIELGADVINISAGGPATSSVETAAVQYAMEHKVPITVSAGNTGSEMIGYPGSLPGAIAVGSSNGRNELSDYSSHGPHVSISAPGERILSLLFASNTGYVSFSGTSMAAPFVAGVVALIKQKFPEASTAQIKKLMENTAMDIEDPGFDEKSGYGIVQPKAALAVSSLPDVYEQYVEFTYTQDSKAIEDVAVNIFNSSGIWAHTLNTDALGKVKIKLSEGTYSFKSSYLGVEHTGTFDLSNKELAITKNFDAATFNDYFRIDTFENSADKDSVDTQLKLFRKEVDATDPTISNFIEIGINDDKNFETYYSELIFKAIKGTTYKIEISVTDGTSDDEKSGNFIVLLNSDIFSTRLTEGTGTGYSSGSDMQVDTSYSGVLADENAKQEYVFTYN